MIEPNSATWRHVIEFAKAEKQDAIAMLIADRDSERQRGIIAILDKLLAEAGEDQFVDFDEKQ